MCRIPAATGHQGWEYSDPTSIFPWIALKGFGVFAWLYIYFFKGEGQLNPPPWSLVALDALRSWLCHLSRSLSGSAKPKTHGVSTSLPPFSYFLSLCRAEHGDTFFCPAPYASPGAGQVTTRLNSRWGDASPRAPKPGKTRLWCPL